MAVFGIQGTVGREPNIVKTSVAGSVHRKNDNRLKGLTIEWGAGQYVAEGEITLLCLSSYAPLLVVFWQVRQFHHPKRALLWRLTATFIQTLETL